MKSFDTLSQPTPLLSGTLYILFWEGNFVLYSSHIAIFLQLHLYCLDAVQPHSLCGCRGLNAHTELAPPLFGSILGIVLLWAISTIQRVILHRDRRQVFRS